MNNKQQKATYIYTYVHHKNEHDLCRMEMRSFFGFDTPLNFLISDVKVDPSRSPFIEERLEVMFEADGISDMKILIQDMKVSASTYKVYCFNRMDLGETKKIPHPERRQVERELGLVIDGEPDLDNPEVVFGLVLLNNRWYFGNYTKSNSVWHEHLHKPNSYSTALNTRVARAISNIAVPHVDGIRAIDPCCGIGTVVVEALSMGIDLIGRDINPTVCQGARENIAYFNLKGEITNGPISEVSEHYDVCIIDLPYNLYTHITREEQFDIIKQARRIADKCVIVTIETIDDLVEDVGFKIMDRCITKKHLFVREILLCE
ncbi:RsmD family RNA methyltransferase [Ureibacillus chungkukjangi]|uniref:TRM11 family SAM-dependent methyltransferase n=1 Tax=Ureibacillus chungkukjangi TaxID=1202712 RepID=UPI002041EE89|nr:RsmD family RNA methyltransferase [Ureibacillus chungkukjangi]MCM3387024.1 RsmD family RNA methyltransferase [Ureibacillus chungkukjangi]